MGSILQATTQQRPAEPKKKKIERERKRACFIAMRDQRDPREWWIIALKLGTKKPSLPAVSLPSLVQGLAVDIKLKPSVVTKQDQDQGAVPNLSIVLRRI